MAMRYQVDQQTSFIITRAVTDWETVRVVVPIRVQPTFISATIFGSLEGSIAPHTTSRASNFDLALKIADIYGWDVDFTTDLRTGDRIDLVVEKRYAEDKFIGYGDVLISEFHVRNRELSAVRYVDTHSDASYFTLSGESLRRTFLRSPVKFSRISSKFNYRRVHPVLNIARPHRGVDYVAPLGAPVQATADGVVRAVGYSKERGHYVEIRHGGSYSSLYLHLSKIANGVRQGLSVKQADVIGSVGKSGNATGVHLHYSLTQGTRYIDPLAVQFPAAAPVPARDWDAFAQQRDRWFALLRSAQSNHSQPQSAGGALP